jgi:hypothetical protein
MIQIKRIIIFYKLVLESVIFVTEWSEVCERELYLKPKVGKMEGKKLFIAI